MSQGSRPWFLTGLTGSCGRGFPVKLERCRSGRTGTTGNRVGEQSSRGFESRPLRHASFPIASIPPLSFSFPESPRHSLISTRPLVVPDGFDAVFGAPILTFPRHGGRDYLSPLFGGELEWAWTQIRQFHLDAVLKRSTQFLQHRY